VNRTDIYRQTIKRTFADLYSVSPDTVDVSWTTGKTIVLQCAGKTFLHPILSDPDDNAPEFTCPDEDPVMINLQPMNGTSWNSRSDLWCAHGTVLH
jgi:hypothetical protein